MSSYELWGHWSPLDECFAWIREKVIPGGTGGGGGGGGRGGGGGGGEPRVPRHPGEGEEGARCPTVYRRVNKLAKARPGRSFNPVIGRPIQLPDLTSTARKDDITKVLHTLQLIRARSGGATADGGRDHLTYYVPFAD